MQIYAIHGVCVCVGILGHDYACNKWGYMIYYIVI